MNSCVMKNKYQSLTAVRRRLFIAIWSLLALATMHSAYSQNSERSIQLTNSSIGYLEHLPSDYNETTERYPVMIFLHGIGERGNGTSDLYKVKKNGPPQYIDQGHDMSFTVDGKKESFIVISPQLRPDYNSWPAFYVDYVVEHVKNTYRIDPDRIYLTGLSLGGGGCWAYASERASYANKIAALVPICGAKAYQSSKVSIITDAKIPVWALHGDADRVVPVRHSIDWTTGINELSPDLAKLTIYPGAGHGAAWYYGHNPTHQYHDPNVYEWMLQQRRNATSTPSPTPGPAPTPTPTPPANQAPVAKAGSDVSVELPIAQVVLDGSSSQDPDGTIASYAWRRVSGNAAISLAGQNTKTLTITNLQAGDYTFELEVKDDKGASATDRVAVAVAAAPAPPTNDCGCDHMITSANSYVNGQSLGVKPGDVVCVQAGQYDYLNLFNFQGSETAPITIKNCGGQVRIGNSSINYGIVMNNNQYVTFTGTGDSNYKYGFKVIGGSDGRYLASGFGASGRSSDFTADHVEITKVEAAVMAKTSPTCDESTWRENFTMRNVKFHDFYIHDIKGEGFYIGHTSFKVTVNCSGTSREVEPHRIENLRVYNNIVENAGWDGIQVAQASSNCKIFNNRVYNYGTANMSSQQGGILLGGNSTGEVYNNWVEKGTGSGIQVFGTGTITVYNNVVLEAGDDAIFCDDRSPVAMTARFINNTIVNPVRDGIRLYNDQAAQNVVYNNLIVSPGSLGSYGNATRAYLFLGNGVEVSEATNHFATTEGSVSFKDYANDEFQLDSNSPAVNQGTDVSQYGVTEDMEGNARPAHGAYDIGAFEAASASTPAPTPTPPSVPSDMVAGLNYAYYEGHWSVLPAFAGETAVKTGSVTNFDLSVRDQDSDFGVVFTGYIKVPATGDYTFVLGSDDGSRLYLDEKLVVDNDGLHGMREQEGTVTLTEGMHAIAVSYFEQSGKEQLQVSWKNTAHGVTTAQAIPAEVLFKGGSAPAPEGNPVPSTTGRVFQINATKNGSSSNLSDWYDIALDGFTGVRTFSNITDRDGKASDLSITAYNGIEQSSIIGVKDNQNALVDGVYPDDVLRYAAFTTGSATVTLSNLSQNNVYHINIHGGRATSGSKVTNYIVNGVTKSLQCVNNEDQVLTFEAVSPNAQGEIVIKFQQGGDTWGYLNAIVVEELDSKNLRSSGAMNNRTSAEDKLGSLAGDNLQPQVYPNPFAGRFFLDLSDYQDEEVTVTLFDQVGNKLMTTTLRRPWNSTSWKEEMKPRLTSNGIHILQVQSVTQGTQMIRIVAE